MSDFPETLLEFQPLFPNETACTRHLERIRWPEGFECPSCGLVGEPWRLQARPRVLECRHCGHQVSLTAGTVMHRTRQPLPVWFWAAHLVTTQTPGMSALQFQRQLGVRRYETAFQMLHELRAAMVRPGRDRIGAEWPVEVDETYVGGTQFVQHVECRTVQFDPEHFLELEREHARNQRRNEKSALAQV